MSAIVNYGSNANQSVVTDHTIDVLTDILNEAGLNSCLITSTSRTPDDQARAMYNNIEATGAAAQKALYASPGDAVINVYVTEKARGKTATEIKAAMRAKIVALGPSRVSRHCGDPKKLNVIDVAPSSIADKPSFEDAIEAAKSNGKIRQYFMPRDGDPAYHLEIPQP